MFPIFSAESPFAENEPPATLFATVIVPPPEIPLCAIRVVLLVLFRLNPGSEIFPPAVLIPVNDKTFDAIVEFSPAESARVLPEILPVLLPEYIF